MRESQRLKRHLLPLTSYRRAAEFVLTLLFGSQVDKNQANCVLDLAYICGGRHKRQTKQKLISVTKLLVR